MGVLLLLEATQRRIAAGLDVSPNLFTTIPLLMIRSRRQKDCQNDEAHRTSSWDQCIRLGILGVQGWSAACYRGSRLLLCVCALVGTIPGRSVHIDTWL